MRNSSMSTLGRRRSAASIPGADVEKWDEIANQWIDRSRDDWWRAHSDAVNGALLARWLAPGTSAVLKTDLFDEAVAEGLWSTLQSRSALAVGLDISSRVASAAHKRDETVIAVAGDVRTLPFPTSSFDAVVSLSTLDHFRTVADLRAAFGELRRVLHPGGQLILTMDNPFNPLVALRNALPYAVVHGLGLVPYYVGVTGGPGQLRRWLKAAGFEVQEIVTTVHCPRVMAVAAGRLLRRLGARTKRAYANALVVFERMAALPTRFQTGHFIAVRCTAATATPVAGVSSDGVQPRSFALAIGAEA